MRKILSTKEIAKRLGAGALALALIGGTVMETAPVMGSSAAEANPVVMVADAAAKTSSASSKISAATKITMGSVYISRGCYCVKVEVPRSSVSKTYSCTWNRVDSLANGATKVNTMKTSRVTVGAGSGRTTIVFTGPAVSAVARKIDGTTGKYLQAYLVETNYSKTYTLK